MMRGARAASAAWLPACWVLKAEVPLMPHRAMMRETPPGWLAMKDVRLYTRPLMVVQQSDGDACCATVAAVITVPLDPELLDPELLDPELPEADELAELVARVPIR